MNQWHRWKVGTGEYQDCTQEEARGGLLLGSVLSAQVDNKFGWSIIRRQNRQELAVCGVCAGSKFGQVFQLGEVDSALEYAEGQI